MNRIFKDEGVVLSRINYSEGDRIITIYSKGNGKITLMARGVRKTKSRKRGHLELFTRINFSAVMTKGMPILSEAETIDAYDDVRMDLKKVSVAFYMAELVGRIVQTDEKNDRIYDLLTLSLDQLRTSRSLKKQRHEFIRRVLVAAGFWPLGKRLPDPDSAVEKIVERQLVSALVGKKILS